MKKKIRVGSRESRLAVAQSELVMTQIQNIHPHITFELVTMKTQGDLILDRSLDKIGGKGLFIKELEMALLENQIDFAVHSYKDMPVEIPRGLQIAAVSKREDPRDVLVTPRGMGFDQLPKGAVVGTGSKRRELQIKALRPDLCFKPLRGNVNTRLKKLYDGAYDAIVLAAAGLKRLGLEAACGYYFPVDVMIPAVAQGVMCVETRQDADIDYLLDSVHCVQTLQEVEAERAYLAALNGGCSIPIGAHAQCIEGQLTLLGMLGNEAMDKLWRHKIAGEVSDAKALGEALAREIESMGGMEL